MGQRPEIYRKVGVLTDSYNLSSIGAGDPDCNDRSSLRVQCANLRICAADRYSTGPGKETAVQTLNSRGLMTNRKAEQEKLTPRSGGIGRRYQGFAPPVRFTAIRERISLRATQEGINSS